MMRRPSPAARLLDPRGGAGGGADHASRRAVIAGQRRGLRRARRVRRLLRAFAGLGATGLAGAAAFVMATVGAHWLLTTPLLAVTEVEVEGARRVPEDLVRREAVVAPGTNLLAVDPAGLEARVAALPGVRRARVVRHLPGRITILVEEREPYALVNPGEAEASALVWIDAEGHVVGSAPRPGAASRPILSGVTPAAARAGGGEALRTGIGLLRAIERAGGRVAGRISEIDLASPDGPVLYLLDGAAVRVGTEAWAERLARLDGVLDDLESRNETVRSVDLRFRDQVVLTPKTLAPETPAARATPVRPRPWPGRARPARAGARNESTPVGARRGAS